MGDLPTGGARSWIEHDRLRYSRAEFTVKERQWNLRQVKAVVLYCYGVAVSDCLVQHADNNLIFLLELTEQSFSFKFLSQQFNILKLEPAKVLFFPDRIITEIISDHFSCDSQTRGGLLIVVTSIQVAVSLLKLLPGSGHMNS